MDKIYCNNALEANHLEFDEVRCDFCNSDKFKIILKSKDYLFRKFSKEFRIVQCQNCELFYTNPRFRKKSLHKLYSSSLNNSFQLLSLNQRYKPYLPISKEILTDFFNYPLLKKSKIRKLIQFPNYVRIYRKWKKREIVPNFIRNGKILEVGCSYGGFLLQLKKLGWIVKGIEINEKAVDFAKNLLNLDILNIDLEEFTPEFLYDKIYLRMVIEHLESPKKIIKRLHSFLKPKGRLILSIPDFSGLEVKIFKKYAYTLQLPYHLYHFTPSSIKRYLKAAKFSKIKTIHENTDRDLINPLKYMNEENPNNIIIKIILKIVSIKLIRKTILKIFVNLLATLGITSRMIIIAEK